MARRVEERVHRILRKSPRYRALDAMGGADGVDLPAALESGERVLGLFHAGGEAGDVIITNRAIWWRDPEWAPVRYVDIDNFASPASKTGDPLLMISLRTGEVRPLRIEAREDSGAAVWTFVRFLMRVVGDRKREAAVG